MEQIKERVCSPFFTKRLIVLSIYCVSVFSSAFAKPALYKEPSSGPTATITFQNESDMHANIYLFEQGLLCKQRRTISFNSSANLKKIKINSRRKIAFRYGLNRGRLGTCEYTISFTPKQNDNYLVSARTSRNKRKCHLQLIRLHPQGIYSRVDFEIRRPKSAFRDKSAHCFPIEEKLKRVFTDE